MPRLRKLAPLFLLVALASLAARASRADDAVTIGTSFKLRSEALGEERDLLVYTPPGYARGGKFPVLYMTDGETQFLHTAGTVDFLTRVGRISPLIVVAVRNSPGHRTRDLTQTHAAFGDGAPMPGSGGADKFLAFLETELIPAVERKYRTAPFRIFAGHSFGGLFALHTLATRPALFGGVIAVSPTLNWDGDLPIRELKTMLAGRPSLEATLFVSLGNEGPELDKRLADLQKLLKRERPKGFSWGVLQLPADDHGSVVLKSHYDGLLKVFEEWRLPVDARTGAYAGGLAGLKAHYAGLSRRFGYTIDPPEIEVNLLGYTELGAKQMDRALEAFRFNMAIHPESANAHDSLGEALEKKGDLAAARESYAHAVEMGKLASDPLLDAFQQHLDAIDAKLKGTR